MMDDIHTGWRVVSWLCGWIYFIAPEHHLNVLPMLDLRLAIRRLIIPAHLSFFPQAILNHSRRTTQGMLPDFPLLNVFGFGCYTLSALLFLYSSVVRDQYAVRHPHSPEPTVRFNDLAFGTIGFLMSILCYSQFYPRLWGWEHKPNVQRHALRITLALISGGLVALGVVFAIISAEGNGIDGTKWSWIDLVYCMEYVKLAFTIFKYIPQTISNFRRQSTLGWSITQQLLDFTGGVLSLFQLIIDSSLQNDWSGLSGNPLKFGLANISLVFDIIFILQHFVLFGPVEETTSVEVSEDFADGTGNRLRDEREPLLPNADRV
ncbi:hypothetical protein AC579_8757 [Pseudocercospora musae]|uniref:Cystinosin n=1 Tax=Pseudocercospora musae TaxID=113226 RepID=A0A139IW68_9PEZI|nr:hypothetical protein AC579_8757 [Pseudocercospora musae]